MRKIKRAIITGVSLLAFIGICMGIAYFQGKDGIGVPKETKTPRLLTDEEHRLYEELENERNGIVLDTMILEELQKQRDKLASKRNPSELDTEMIKSYDANIAEYTQRLSENPSFDDLTSRIDDLLYE